jgi:hypothetical protein
MALPVGVLGGFGMLWRCGRGTFVVHADDLVMDFQVETFRANGERAYDLNPAFAVDGALSVEGGCAWHICGCGSGYEIEDILVRLLESEVDWEGWEGGEFGVELV